MKIGCTEDLVLVFYSFGTMISCAETLSVNQEERRASMQSSLNHMGPTNYIGLNPDLCRSKQNLEATTLFNLAFCFFDSQKKLKVFGSRI